MLPRGRAGFTLLEVLVVMVIIGITIGFITLKVDTRRDNLAEEVRRFAALVGLAGEEAVLQTREFGLQVTPTGYFFLQAGANGFVALEGDDVLRARQLPADLEIDLTLAGEPVTLQEAKTTTGEGEEGEPPPRIYLLSSGEVTPFELRIRDRHSAVGFLVTGSMTGHLTIEPLGTGS